MDDVEIVETMLEDASRFIAAQLDYVNKTDCYLYPDEAYCERLTQVCVQIARRAIGEDTVVPYGVSQFSQGAGGYTEQFTMANPYGSFFLDKNEKVLLGLNEVRIGFTLPGAPEVGCCV
ncbi:MAG: phage Gp19/Gp15/Gp42 family protein [Oscillospiraceae bacterium]|nr:phage Gp19/Gp15/Gp42 family protein [Oscillospiraceae bacterium]